MQVSVKIRGNVRGEEAMHQLQKGDRTQHWANFLADLYSEYNGFQLVWNEDQEREIHISKAFWEECECGFQHVLEFAHLNELEVEELDD